MKKILFSVVALAMLTACGGGDRQMYFDNDSSRTFNDPNAEFDTLSYAVGMNIGLSISLQNGDLELIDDLIRTTLLEELASESINHDFMAENTRYMSRFSMERSRPYQMTKRMNAFVQTDCPDTLTLPEIYNEEFTREKVSKSFGYDIAKYIRRMALPVNSYWLLKAMEDATVVESPAQIDSLMIITGNDVRTAMSKYATVVLPEYNAERTREWLKGVAAQDDVRQMIVEGDTLYYRIDVAGNGQKPQSLVDTVAFDYEVYTRSGMPVESTAQRMADLKYNLEQTKTSDLFADTTMRNERIHQIEAQIERFENLRIPMKNSIIKGAQYAMQHVSVGGEITMWVPASLAYGARGNRVVGPNDGIVMRVKLKDLTVVDTEQAEVEQDGEKLTPGQSNVKVIPATRPGKTITGAKPVMHPVTKKEVVKKKVKK